MKLKRFTNIVEHAGSGLRMPETLARQIDDETKSLPKDFSYRRIAKSVGGADFRLDPGSRTDVSVINTASVDREGDCILPNGIDWSQYANTVTFAHQYDQLPVGSCLWLNRQGDQGIAAKTHYPTKPDDWSGPWLPSAILHLMQQPVPTCTGKSIGIIPIHVRDATRDEIARNPVMKNVRVVDKCKLLEYAVAPIPVLPDAEMIAVSKCLASGELDSFAADIIRKSIEQYAFKRPTPLPKNNPMSRYAHIDFKPPKEVQKAHKEGLERHAAGESKGHATPEMLAMARHVSEGGEVSPDYARKAHEYHQTNAHHLASKQGTPAYCLAMLHGGHAGREHYAHLVKTMEEADAQPSTAIDENGAPAGLATKSAGASESTAADGGYAAPTDTGVDASMDLAMKMPACKACKTNAYVSHVDTDAVKGKMYECSMCGKAFSEDETIAADGTVTPATSPDRRREGDGSNMPGINKPAQKAVTTKAEGTVKLNTACESRAMGMAERGEYTDATWEAPDGGDRKEADCLGVREGKDVEPSQKFVAPIIKDGKLYTHAVHDAESRMSGTAIGEAAARISAKIKEHEGKARQKSLSEAEVLAAAERQVEADMPRLMQKAIEIASDKLILAMGGV